MRSIVQAVRTSKAFTFATLAGLCCVAACGKQEDPDVNLKRIPEHAFYKYVPGSAGSDISDLLVVFSDSADYCAEQAAGHQTAKAQYFVTHGQNRQPSLGAQTFDSTSSDPEANQISSRVQADNSTCFVNAGDFRDTKLEIKELGDTNMTASITINLASNPNGQVPGTYAEDPNSLDPNSQGAGAQNPNSQDPNAKGQDPNSALLQRDFTATACPTLVQPMLAPSKTCK